MCVCVCMRARRETQEQKGGQQLTAPVRVVRRIELGRTLWTFDDRDRHGEARREGWWSRLQTEESVLNGWQGVLGGEWHARRREDEEEEGASCGWGKAEEDEGRTKNVGLLFRFLSAQTKDSSEAAHHVEQTRAQREWLGCETGIGRLSLREGPNASSS